MKFRLPSHKKMFMLESHKSFQGLLHLLKELKVIIPLFSNPELNDYACRKMESHDSNSYEIYINAFQVTFML